LSTAAQTERKSFQVYPEETTKVVNDASRTFHTLFYFSSKFSTWLWI